MQTSEGQDGRVSEKSRFRGWAPSGVIVALLAYGGCAAEQRRTTGVMDQILLDPTLDLSSDHLLARQYTPDADPLVKDRTVMRDEVFLCTWREPEEVEPLIASYAKKHGVWDKSWIRWTVFRKTASNEEMKITPPEATPTLIWIAVDVNSSIQLPK